MILPFPVSDGTLRPLTKEDGVIRAIIRHDNDRIGMTRLFTQTLESRGNAFAFIVGRNNDQDEAVHR